MRIWKKKNVTADSGLPRRGRLFQALYIVEMGDWPPDPTLLSVHSQRLISARRSGERASGLVGLSAPFKHLPG